MTRSSSFPLPLLLLAFLLLAGITRAAEPVWDLEGSDLGVWEVWDLPTEPEGKEKLKPAGSRLCLFGYQIDRKGVPGYPVHSLDELTHDLVLQVPVKRVKQGGRFERTLRYEDIAGHTPMEVELVGRVTALGDSEFTVVSTVSARAVNFDEDRWPHRAKRVLELTGEVTSTFDLKSRMVTSGRVTLHSTVGQRPKEGTATPANASQAWGHRFELRRIREYAPGRLAAAVGNSIDKGLVWLRKRVNKEGIFGKYGDAYPSGQTCIATLTLLVCGTDREDELIQSLMKKIRGWKPKKTYEITLALMAMEAYYAPADEIAEVHAGRRALPARRQLAAVDLAWVQELTDTLVNGCHVTEAGGRWSYNVGDGHYDLSNTQYASLGLLAAWRCGAEIHESVWLELGQWFLSNLPRDGEKAAVALQRVGDRDETTIAGKRVQARGFAYTHGDRNKPDKLRGSMTAGAIASMRMVIDVLRADRSRKANGRLVRNLEQAIDEAWGWLAERWCLQRHAGMLGTNRLLYYLYAVERAGVLDRVVKVDGRDWYAEGAAYLIETQSDNGHWTQGGWVYHTCFSLLFLKRGTLPVITGE